ncbi:uncharacterized protein LOC112544972 [Pelodiscus sinensis]|uniref:uncharacterized protein LOC112544972 n=1 Tax=Pelodiscus sinensis TaxID=13735 RepID=UPI003F6C0ABC
MVSAFSGNNGENNVEPLAIIFENSWRLGEIPDDWKKANVPIFKKGKKDNPGNYKLVSLTSVPRKIMEGILKESILKHLEEGKVIRNSQHGFMKGKSCLTNLISFYDESHRKVGPTDLKRSRSPFPCIEAGPSLLKPFLTDSVQLLVGGQPVQHVDVHHWGPTHGGCEGHQLDPAAEGHPPGRPGPNRDWICCTGVPKLCRSHRWDPHTDPRT